MRRIVAQRHRLGEAVHHQLALLSCCGPLRLTATCHPETTATSADATTSQRGRQAVVAEVHDDRLHAPTPPPLQEGARRRKRLNYADRDRVLVRSSDGVVAGLSSSPMDACRGSGSYYNSTCSAPPPIHPRRSLLQALLGTFGATSGSKGVPLLSRALLRPLSTAVGGPCIESVLRVFAGTFVAYGCPIAIYLRASTAPPICGAQAIDDDTPSCDATTEVLSSASATTSRGLLAECHPSLYVGRSPIHGRGIFTRHPLPQGTRIMTARRMAFVDGIQYLMLLSDTHERIPDTLHYTLPTGRLRECALHAHAHHLINHSCASNVCVGLSRRFWSQHAPSAALQSAPYFDDPNSFFVTRDVAAGEELTINYHHRYGHVVLPPRDDDCNGAVIQTEKATTSSVVALPRWLRASPGSSSSSAWRQTGETDRGGGVVAPQGGDRFQLCRCGAAACSGSILPRSHAEQRTYADVDALLAAGFDDEITMLSRLHDAAAVQRYLTSCLHGEHQRTAPGAAVDAATMANCSGGSPTATSSPPSWSCVALQKRRIVLQYRFVFGVLNTVAPEQ